MDTRNKCLIIDAYPSSYTITTGYSKITVRLLYNRIKSIIFHIPFKAIYYPPVYHFILTNNCKIRGYEDKILDAEDPCNAVRCIYSKINPLEAKLIALNMENTFAADFLDILSQFYPITPILAFTHEFKDISGLSQNVIQVKASNENRWGFRNLIMGHEAGMDISDIMRRYKVLRFIDIRGNLRAIVRELKDYEEFIRENERAQIILKINKRESELFKTNKALFNSLNLFYYISNEPSELTILIPENGGVMR